MDAPTARDFVIGVTPGRSSRHSERFGLRRPPSYSPTLPELLVPLMGAAAAPWHTQAVDDEDFGASSGFVLGPLWIVLAVDCPAVQGRFRI
jgi:hypothetical protein